MRHIIDLERPIIIIIITITIIIIIIYSIKATKIQYTGSPNYMPQAITGNRP
jgi:hypothetical protein